jgi:hypothetical protein
VECVALTVAARSPANARAVYDTLFDEACRILAAYLRTKKLSRRPEQHAEMLLSATTGGAVIRHLYGVDEPSGDLSDDKIVGKDLDMKSIREAVNLVAASWK